jgi:hypothetical protein
MQILMRLGVMSLCFLITCSAWGLRCGNDLVMLGDVAGRVTHICGKPENVNTFEEKRIVSNRVVVISQGERWTYNFGPQDFLYVLTFVDGKLTAMDTDGYGY